MRDSQSDWRDGNVGVLERRAQVVRWSRYFAVALALTLFGIAAFSGYSFWRQRHLQAQAQAFAGRADYPSAVLVARHLLQLDPNNLVIIGLMAQMADHLNNHDAISWRRKLVELRPTNTEYRLALARTALHFGESDVALHALEALPDNARVGADFHLLTGALAVSRRQLEAAETEFAAAVADDPQNDSAAMNYAAVRLQSSKRDIAAAARREFISLATRPATRTAALRALLANALAHNHQDEASPFLATLLAQPDCTFADRLLELEVTAGDAPAEAAALDHCKSHVGESAQAAGQLVAWMNRHEHPADAIAWSTALPEKMRETYPMPLLRAESYSCARDWPALAEFVRAKNWGDMEAVRLAIEFHALRQSGSSTVAAANAQAIWRAAIRSCQGRDEQLSIVAQLASGWGYQAEAEETLWIIAGGKGKAEQSLVALQQLYRTAGNTRGLLRVAKRALELNPQDFLAASRYASFGLLVNPDRSSRRLASKLYSEHPGHASLATTYAFALHTEGKTAEALKVIGALTDAQLRDPGVAAYYVVMLVANGENDRALSFLPAAKTAALLPEERQLLADATHKLLGQAIATSVRN